MHGQANIYRPNISAIVTKPFSHSLASHSIPSDNPADANNIPLSLANTFVDHHADAVSVGSCRDLCLASG